MEKPKNTYSDKLKDPRWQKKRLEILERDSWTCQWCQDTTTTLHIHHLKYKGEPWEVENEFLITLCENCHDAMSNGFNEAGNRLLAALKSKAFATEHILRLAFAIENGNLSGLPYEPTTDIIAMIFYDEDVYSMAYNKFFEDMREKFSKVFQKV